LITGEKMRITLITLVLAATVLTGNLMAAGSGTSSGTTLLQPVSAKSAGTAEACTALSGDIICLHYNPAGLASLKAQDVSMMYQLGVAGDSFGAVIYGKNMSFANIGASLLYYNTGVIQIEDTNGDLLNEVGQSDLILTVGAAKKLSNFSAGLGIKAITSQIFGKGAAAVAVDIGGLYEGVQIAGGDVNFGISVQNLGTKLTYGGTPELLPLKLRFGASYSKTLNTGKVINGYLDFPYLIYDKMFLAQLGAEYMFNSTTFGRIGYRYNVNSPETEMEPFCLGFGVVKEKFTVDYSFSITKGIGIPHRLSIRLKI